MKNFSLKYFVLKYLLSFFYEVQTAFFQFLHENIGAIVQDFGTYNIDQGTKNPLVR